MEGCTCSGIRWCRGERVLPILASQFHAKPMNGSCLVCFELTGTGFELIVELQLFGVLRTQLRTPHSSSLRPLFRSLSRSSFPLVQQSVHVPLRQPSPILTNSRLISLSSIFAPRKITPTPPPSVVAHISTVEADANAHPQDVQKQITLYEALLSTKVKAGYDVVISRWERMCEFVSFSNVNTLYTAY